MWANYYDGGFVFLGQSQGESMDDAASDAQHIAVPVAVIPLDDVEALVEKAKTAFNLEGSGLFTPAMRAALTAIGVLPRQRKGGAK